MRYQIPATRAATLRPTLLPAMLVAVTATGCGGDVFGTLTTRHAELARARQRVSENSGSARLAVLLNAASDDRIAIPYRLTGTATASEDYRPGSPFVIVPAGATRAEMSIPIINDALDEVEETIVVTLRLPDDVLPTGIQTHVITIVDDDAPPALSVSDAAASEGTGTLTFPVELSGPSERVVTVDYATADSTAISGVDYTGKVGTLVFPAGETTRTVTIAVLDDDVDEADEELSLVLTGANQATLGRATATGSIVDDDDPPTLSIADTNVPENAGFANVTISLSEASERLISIDLATRNDSALAGFDYDAWSGIVALEPGTTSVSIPLAIINDALDEVEETFFIDASSVSNATLLTTRATITIQDDDPAPFVGFATDFQYQPELERTVGVAVTLEAPSGRTITVPFALDGTNSSATLGDDFTLSAGPLVFAPGETTHSIMVSIVDDAAVESDEDVVLTLDSPLNATLGAIQSHTMRILDGESQPLIIAAETLDTDQDGHLDHYRLTFNKPIDDSTFPGFVADNAGNSQSEWRVAGRTGVVLVHTAASPGGLDVAGDEILYLRFDESTAFDTGTTPELTTSTTPGLRAADNTVLAPVDALRVDEEDGAAPILAAVVGTIGSTGVRAVFSEAVVPAGGSCPGGSVPVAALDYDDVSDSGAGGLSTLPDSDGCDGWVEAQLNGPLTANDVGVDTLAAAPGALTDLAGNSANETARAISAETAPALVWAETLDADEDGHLDYMRLTFSKPVLDATFPGYVPDALGDAQGDWWLSDYTGVVLAHGSAAPEADVSNDNVLYLAFDETAAFDTGALPDLLTVAFPGLLAFDGTALPDDGGVTETDAASPVLVAAVATADSTSLTVTFSEGLASSGSCPGATISLGELTYNNEFSSGATALAGPANPDFCDGQAVLTVNAPFVLGDLGVDEIAAQATITDAAGNPALSTPRAIGEAKAPTLTDVFTLDANGDGHLDTLRLVFDKPVVDASFPGFTANNLGASQMQWFIERRIGAVLAHGAAAPERDVADDDVLYLSFDAATAFDTDFLPAVTTGTTPMVVAFDGTALAPITVGVVATDAAPPLLVAATVVGGTSALTLTFSEPVSSVSSSACPTGTLSDSDLTYVGGGTGVDGIAPGTDSACDRRAQLTALSGVFTTVDIDSDTVAPAAEALRDVAGNLARTTEVKVKGAVPPTLLEVLTLDANEDGRLDHVRLTFSKPVDDATFPGYVEDDVGSTATDWTLGGFDGLRLAHGANAPALDVANDEVLYLTFTESGAYDTALLPSLLTGQTPGLLAFDGSALPQVVGGYTLADGAGPVLVAAVASVGSPDLLVSFSEGVSASAACSLSGTVHSPDDFEYDGLEFGPAFALVDEEVDACSGQALLHSTQTFAAEDLGEDTVAPKVTIRDEAGNPAAPTPAVVDGVVIPKLETVTTLDLDADGQLDHLRLDFDRVVRDSTFPGFVANGVGTASGWQLTGFAEPVLAHGSAVPVLDVVDDATLYLALTPTGAFNTGLVPQLTAASPGIEAFDGAPLPPVGIDTPEIDGAPPVLLAAVAQFGSTDLTVVFSEGVSSSGSCPGGTIDTADLVYGDEGGPATSLQSVATHGCDGRAVVVVDPAFDTGDLGADTVTAQPTLLDAADNPARPITVTVEGFSLPKVQEARTLDIDEDGRLDHVRVTFEYPVIDSTFPGFVADGIGTSQDVWHVGNFLNVVLAHGAFAPLADTPNDAVLYLSFTESRAFDTGLLPFLWTEGAPVLQAFDTSPIPPVIMGDVPTVDAAAPVLIAANADVGTTKLTLTFSEGVTSETSGGCLANGTVDKSEFLYKDVDGPVTKIDGGPYSVCTGQTTVDGDQEFTALDVGADEVTPATSIEDNAGNIAVGKSQVIGPIEPPKLKTVETMDRDANGHIDHLRLTFDKPVRDATFPEAMIDGLGAPQFEWFVAGYTGVVLAHGTFAPETDIHNDDTIYLAFNESGAFDTANVPVLSTTASPKLEAFDGALLDPTTAFINTEFLDDAAPVLLAARAEVGKDEVLLTFSEGVAAAGLCSVGGGSLTDADLEYVQGNGPVSDFAVGVYAGAEGGCSGQLSMKTDAAFEADDLDSDRVRVRDPSTLRDDSDNAAVGDVLVTGPQPPGIDFVDTLDDDEDGQIDFLRVTFSVPVQDATFPGYVADDFGGGQSSWLVSGYTNVVLAHGFRAPEPDLEDDAIIYLKFDETGAFDTDALPDLTILGASAILAYDGSAVNPGSHASRDRAAPVLVSAVTEAGSNILTVTFSEGVSASVPCSLGGIIALGDFEYDGKGAGVTCPDPINDPASCDLEVFDPDLSACDGQVDFRSTAQSLSTVFDSGDLNNDTIAPNPTILDEAGNLAIGNPTVVGEAQILEIELAQTLDLDGDGHLDHYRLTFSANVRDDTFPGFLADDVGTATDLWLVFGRSGVALAHGAAVNPLIAPLTDTINDPVIYLAFDPSTAFDTGALPEVTTTPTPLLESFAGEPLLPLGTGSVDETDGAPPLVVAAIAVVGQAPLRVTLSEGVSATGTCPGGTVTHGDFAYVGNATGVTKIDGDTASKSACTGQVAFDGDVDFDGVDIDRDTIAATTSIRDAASPPNDARTTPVFVTGPRPITLEEATTLDVDNDGHLDRVRLRFSGPVDDSSFPNYVADGVGTTQGEWSVGSYADVVLLHGAAVAPFDVDLPNDDVLTLGFTESTAFDTGVLPEVTTVPNPTLTAIDGSPLLEVTPGTVPEADGAAPVLVAATAAADAPWLTITFSEGVSNTTCSGGTVDGDDFRYIDTPGVGAVTGLLGVGYQLCLGQAVLTANADFDAQDLNSDRIAPESTIVDNAGNSAVGLSQVIGVAEPPKIVSATTLDFDGDGHLDYYRVRFDKAVDDSTFPGYVENGEGGSQDHWFVEGRTGVVLAHGTDAPVTDVVDDDTLYLRFAPAVVFDTGALPELTTSATPELLAFDAAPLEEVTAATLIDGAQPVLLAAVGTFGTPDLTVTFSEGVSALGTCPGGTVNGKADFAYVNGGGPVFDVSGTFNACDGQARLTAVDGTDVVTDYDTSDFGADTIAGQRTITDPAGNNVRSGVVTITGAGDNPPALTAAETLDSDQNGRLDHVKLTFSRLLNDRTFPGYLENAAGASQSHWSIAGRTGVVLAHGTAAPAGVIDIAGDNVLYLRFDEAGSFDTGELPEVSTDASPGLEAYDGSPLPPTDTTTVPYTDGAAPILVAVVGEENQTPLAVTFSEAVYGTAAAGCPGGAIAATDLLYLNNTGGGATDIGTVVDGDGCDTVVDLTVNAGLTTGDIDSDALIPNDGTIFDAAGNTAPQRSVPITALARPAIDIARTLDVDGDGRIDHYELTFSTTMNDSTFPGYKLNQPGDPQTDWVAAGYTGLHLVHGTAAPATVTDVPNDEVLYLAFDPAADFDGEVTPDLTAADPKLRGTDGSAMLPLATDDVTEEDGAAPIVWAATAQVDETFLNVFFSEPVGTSGTDCSGTIDDTAFSYFNGSGDGVTDLIGATDSDGCDGWVVLTADTKFLESDFADSFAHVGGVIRDAGDNPLDTATIPVDGVTRPYVEFASSTSATTMELIYSEPVDPVVAREPGNYTYVSVGAGCDPGATLQPDLGTSSDNTIWSFKTSPQSSTCRYRIQMELDLKDLNEGATIDPDRRSYEFDGDPTFRVQGALATSLTTFEITFSQPVKAGDTGGGAEDEALYDIPYLGTVVLAERLASDPRKVRITHSVDQGPTFYTVTVSTTVRNDADDESLDPSQNFAPFEGFPGAARSIEDGAVFADPFSDGTTFSFVFAYAGRIYAGPNDNNDAVFRFENDGADPRVVTFAIDDGSGTIYTSFGHNLTRPAHRVEDLGQGATRYYLTPGTDLGWVAAAAAPLAEVSGCTDPGNDAGGVSVDAVDDAADWVELNTNGNTLEPETCEVKLYANDGPRDLDGVDAFVSVQSTDGEYLVFGPHNEGGAGFQHLYLSSTRGADTLNLSFCTISGITLGNTVSLQTVFSDLDEVYFAFASDSNSGRPLMGHTTFNADACTVPSDEVTTPPSGNQHQAHYLPYLGGGGNPPNPQGANQPIGIDGAAVFFDGIQERIYLANNGGIIATDDRPLDSTSVWTEVHESASWTGTTKPIPDIGKLRPGQKGIPFMIEWESHLFVARNRTDGDAELWRFDGTNWKQVVLTDTSAGMNTNNSAISLLVVNGPHLYVGFDNSQNGAELWRTRVGVTGATVGDGGINADFERLGVSGFGPVDEDVKVLGRNQEIISHVSVTNADGESLLYITVGCTSDLADGIGDPDLQLDGKCDRDRSAGATDFAIRMFRQVD